MNKKGFTLIELMISIFIFGIFLAIVIPNFMAYKAAERNRNAIIVQQQDENSFKQESKY